MTAQPSYNSTTAAPSRRVRNRRNPKNGDGPARSSTGQFYGVAAALREKVPVDYGRVREPDMDAWNTRSRAKRQAKAKLAGIIKRLPSLQPIADRLAIALSPDEILQYPEFWDERRRLVLYRRLVRRNR